MMLPVASAHLVGFARSLRIAGLVIAPEQIVTFLDAVRPSDRDRWTTSAKQHLRRSRPGQSARMSSSPCSVLGSGAKRSPLPEAIVMRRCGSRMIAARERNSSSPTSASPAANSRRRTNSLQQGNSCCGRRVVTFRPSLAARRPDAPFVSHHRITARATRSAAFTALDCEI